MPTVITILKGLMGLGPLLSKAVLGLFLLNSGTNKEVLKGKIKEVKDAQKAGKRKSYIASLSDDDVDSGL